MTVESPRRYAGASPERPSEDESAWFAERLRWQSVLFAPSLERRALLALRAPWPLAPRRVRVHRNHAVELALSVARPYLEFAGLAVEWEIGEYDDSLAFPMLDRADTRSPAPPDTRSPAPPDTRSPAPPAAEVVWLDYGRFTARLRPAEIADWLVQRLEALRAQVPGPILVLDWDGPAAGSAEFSERLAEFAELSHDVYLADRTELFEGLGERFFDPEREAISGTRMSAEGAAATARLLGSRWLPALLQPRARAIVTDLDNTLFDGVLGEDGARSLILTPGHEQLHRELLALHESGLFLGLLSRNHPADVEALFRSRPDLPLRWESFDARSLGWGAKSAGLREIAASLRIDPGSVLFIDDNPGELLEAALGIPGLRYLRAGGAAGSGGAATARAVRYFPGLWAARTSDEDRLRAADLRANQERANLLSGSREDLAAYFRALALTLTVGHDRHEHLGRVAELSAKTNQFNLAFSRYTPAEVVALAADPASQVSSVRLEDRLTDSGVVAIAVSRRRGARLVVEELCISCRALGRQLEDLIVAQLITSGPLFAGSTEVTFRFLDGPRNEPARRWLEEFTSEPIPPAPHAVSISTAPDRLLAASTNSEVRVEVLR